MQKIAVILNNLGSNQSTFSIISNMNSSCLSNDLDPAIFELNNVTHIMRARFGIFPINYAYLYDGILVSTDVETTKFSLESCRSKKKIFYVWDLEWMRNLKSFESNQIYALPELKIITRSEDHAKCIERVCRRRVDAIIPQFNLKEISKI